MNELAELFAEYDTNTLAVSDLGIVVRGTQVNYLHRNDDDSVSIWAGNPDTDKYAEELMLDKSEREYVFEEVLDQMLNVRRETFFHLMKKLSFNKRKSLRT